ncbi:MAG: RNA 2',3'-cyclic phosphodiesterase [Thermoplasmata archaeon]|nr:RNA 2',3'-cyclic phosphodiesterase [Thermoplasmata archaeon]
MRAFVAIDLPPVAGLVPTELRPEDHLTLHFFEELHVARLPEVVEAMRDAAQGRGPFELELRGVGAFPNLSRPRVVWAGVTEGASMVHALADQLRQALSAREFPVESRPFIPHRTLARIRSRSEVAWAVQFLTAPENLTRTWARTTVSELLLKQSELTSAGARHTVRERVTLGDPSRSQTTP